MAASRTGSLEFLRVGDQLCKLAARVLEQSLRASMGVRVSDFAVRVPGLGASVDTLCQGCH
jgi:hypothetical protein